MIFIEHLNSRRERNGTYIKWAKFKCEKCNKIIERRCYLGKKQKSCGCKRHEDRNTKLYAVWGTLLNRCKNPKNRYYGSQGISVCEEWKDYINFRTWATTNHYLDGLYLDRIDNSKGYCPENCRFVTPLMSAQNRRTTKIPLSEIEKIKELRAQGVQCKVIAKMYNVKSNTISQISTGDARISKIKHEN